MEDGFPYDSRSTFACSASDCVAEILLNTGDDQRSYSTGPRKAARTGAFGVLYTVGYRATSSIGTHLNVKILDSYLRANRRTSYVLLNWRHRCSLLYPELVSPGYCSPCTSHTRQARLSVQGGHRDSAAFRGTRSIGAFPTTQQSLRTLPRRLRDHQRSPQR